MSNLKQEKIPLKITQKELDYITSFEKQILSNYKTLTTEQE